MHGLTFARIFLLDKNISKGKEHLLARNNGGRLPQIVPLQPDHTQFLRLRYRLSPSHHGKVAVQRNKYQIMSSSTQIPSDQHSPCGHETHLFHSVRDIYCCVGASRFLRADTEPCVDMGTYSGLWVDARSACTAAKSPRQRTRRYDECLQRRVSVMASFTSLHKMSKVF